MHPPMAVCRVCGADCAPDDLLPVHDGGGCRECNGSPACSRCGHARRQHRGTFGGGEPGCKAQVTPNDVLAVGRCGCAGYTTDATALWEEVPIVDVSELRLRRPGEHEADDPPLLAPVRDLLDAGPHFEDLPWRPH